MQETLKLHMRQTRYVKRYMADRWFSRIVGTLWVHVGIHVVLIHDGFELTDLKVA